MAINSTVDWENHPMLAVAEETTSALRMLKRQFNIRMHIMTRGQKVAALRKLRGAFRQLAPKAIASRDELIRDMLDENTQLSDDFARKVIAKSGEAIEAIRSLEKELPGTFDVCEEIFNLLWETRAQISKHWPWLNSGNIEESWRQYERGDLMDFETFKHELLGPEE